MVFMFFGSFSARICSGHFEEKDYVRDLRNELLGLPVRRLLAAGAIPKKALNKDCNCDEELHRKKRASDEDRQNRTAKRARHQLIGEILEQDNLLSTPKLKSKDADTQAEIDPGDFKHKVPFVKIFLYST